MKTTESSVWSEYDVRVVTVCCLLVLAVGVALWPPLVLAAVAWFAGTLVMRNANPALELGAFLVLAVRPSLDIFSERRFGLGPFASSPSVTLGLVVLGLAILLSFRRGATGKLLWPDRHLWAAHVLLLLAYLIAILSGVRLYATVGLEQGVREALRVLSVLAAFLVVYWWCRDAGHYRRGWIYLGAGALIPIGVSLWQLATGAGFSDIEGVYRIQGTFSHPNAYSQYLVAFIIVGVATLTSQRGILRAWIAVVTVGCIVLVLLSYTRTAILALVVGLISLPVLQAPRLGYKTVLRTTVVLLLLGVLIWATGSEMIRERFSTLSLGRDALISAELGESENSFQWRLLNWGILISMGMEHPIAGHGAGMTTVLNPLSADNGVPFNAHDDFVRFFFEGGIVGLLLFTLYSVLICLWVVRRSRLVSPESRGSALGVAAAFLALGLMTGGTTELSLQTADLYQLYGMLALVAALPIVVIPTPHAANVTHVLHHLSRWQGGSE